MSIRCGHHPGTHETVEEVRACFLMHYESGGRNFGHYTPPPDTRDPAITIPPPELERSEQELSDGIWVVEDPTLDCQGRPRIYKLQYNKAQGDGKILYCKILVYPRTPEEYSNDCWQYMGTKPKDLIRKGGRKMTLEEAKKFGELYGRCIRCGRILTREESIEAAIGPVCAGKFAI